MKAVASSAQQLFASVRTSVCEELQRNAAKLSVSMRRQTRHLAHESQLKVAFAAAGMQRGACIYRTIAAPAYAFTAGVSVSGVHSQPASLACNHNRCSSCVCIRCPSEGYGLSSVCQRILPTHYVITSVFRRILLTRHVLTMPHHFQSSPTRGCVSGTPTPSFLSSRSYCNYCRLCSRTAS